MKIRVLSGKLAGTVSEVSRNEADLAIQTGFGELVVEPVDRKPEPQPEPAPDPEPEPAPTKPEDAQKAIDDHYRRRYAPGPGAP